MSDAIAKEGDNVEHTEKQRYMLPDDLPLPDEIADLTQDELRKLDRSLTWKLDLTMMPTVFILFLLNILWVPAILIIVTTRV